jgi:predicted RNA-binding protein with RPS1 domain
MLKNAGLVILSLVVSDYVQNISAVAALDPTVKMGVRYGAAAGTFILGHKFLKAG